MKIGIIIQARTGSTRLPKKVIMEIGSMPMIVYMHKRVSLSSMADEVLIATTDSPSDDELVKVLEENSIPFFRGSEEDVLDRYYQAAKSKGYDAIVRLTGDCPLIDPELIDKIINRYKEENDEKAYVSNILTETFPDGMDIDMFSFDALKDAWNNANLKSQREHIRPYLKGNEKFKQIEIVSDKYLGNIRITVDEPEDLKLIRKIVDKFNGEMNYTLADIIDLLNNDSDLLSINKNFERDEGLKKSLANDEEINKV